MLVVADLRKQYGELVALDGVGLTVAPGRIVGFLGPNGAGKTTAMRCVMGLARPEAGRIEWNGRPVDDGARLRFGYMPEERGLYPRMRIGEQLVHFARLSGLGRSEAREAAGAWLGRLGLLDRYGSRLEELSHGNQQRVQLAVALVHGPELAVLDEPFSGLDPIAVEAMATGLREMALRGAGVLFSSHQLDLVEDVCEDVVVIDRGRVVLAGVLEQLRSASPRRVLEVMVDGIPWSPPIGGAEMPGNHPTRRRFLVDRDTDIEEVLAKAGAQGEVTSFSFEPPSLSDMFREAVTG